MFDVLDHVGCSWWRDHGNWMYSHPLESVLHLFWGWVMIGSVYLMFIPFQGTCRHVSLPGKSIHQQGLHLQMRQPIFSNHHHPSERKPNQPSYD